MFFSPPLIYSSFLAPFTSPAAVCSSVPLSSRSRSSAQRVNCADGKRLPAEARWACQTRWDRDELDCAQKPRRSISPQTSLLKFLPFQGIFSFFTLIFAFFVLGSVWRCGFCTNLRWSHVQTQIYIHSQEWAYGHMTNLSDKGPFFQVLVNLKTYNQLLK